jgi:cytochrome P450
MQRASDLDLPFLDIGQDWFAADPYPHFAAAREKHPWLATSPVGYLINDYKAIREFFHSEDQYAPPYGGLLDVMKAHGTAWGRFQTNHMLAITGDRHQRLRSILAPSFTPRQANKNRGIMREVISDLLDEWVPRRAFDFEEFASYFPITVMCRLIGQSPEAIRPIRSSLETLGLSVCMDPNFLPQLEEATIVLEKFVGQFVADRRAGKRLSDNEDLLDLLLQNQEEGGLDDSELENILIFLFVAGYDTSKNILTIMMSLLADRPEMLGRCGESIDYCRKVIRETFRYMSTAPALRMLGRDWEYRGVVLPKDSMIWFPLNVIGRDPRVAEDAETFDPDRAHANPPIPFGLGAHICLGQYIAKAQLEEGLHLIAQRITNLRSTGPAGWRPYPGTWGIKGLPISFDPVDAKTVQAAL